MFYDTDVQNEIHIAYSYCRCNTICYATVYKITNCSRILLRNPPSLLAALIFMSIVAVAQLIALQFSKVSSRFVQREEDAVVQVAVLTKQGTVQPLGKSR